MFFDTRDPAPLSVRWARVLVPLMLCFAYAAFRVAPAVDGRIPAAEVVTMGLVYAGLMLVAFGALSELVYPRADRVADDAAERPLLEQAPEDAFDWGRIEGDLREFDGPAAHGRYLREVADAWWNECGERERLTDANADLPTEELELLTHEYHPQHHTPARGVPVVTAGTITGRIPAPAPRSGGRHRLTKTGA